MGKLGDRLSAFEAPAAGTFAAKPKPPAAKPPKPATAAPKLPAAAEPRKAAETSVGLMAELEALRAKNEGLKTELRRSSAAGGPASGLERIGDRSSAQLRRGSGVSFATAVVPLSAAAPAPKGSSSVGWKEPPPRVSSGDAGFDISERATSIGSSASAMTSVSSASHHSSMSTATQVADAAAQAELAEMRKKLVRLARAELAPWSRACSKRLTARMRAVQGMFMLGGDMSGGQAGTHAALTLSNAVTNLSVGCWGQVTALELCYAMLYPAIRCDAMRCDAMRCDAMGAGDRAGAAARGQPQEVAAADPLVRGTRSNPRKPCVAPLHHAGTRRCRYLEPLSQIVVKEAAMNAHGVEVAMDRRTACSLRASRPPERLSACGR